MAVITEESRTEKFTASSTEITRVLRVDDYSARLALAVSLLGTVRLVAGRLRRIPPARDPAVPFAFCQSVDIEPVEEDHLVAGSPSDNVLVRTGAYSGGARMTCTYKNFDYEAQEGSSTETSEKNEVELATMSWEFSGQALTLPNRYMVWKEAAAGGGTGTDTLQTSEVSPVVQIPKFDILLTRHFVLNKPTKGILANLGRINKSEFRVGRDTYPAGCLRFDSCQITQKLTNRGLKFFDVTSRFGVMGVYTNYYDDAGAPQVGYVTWQRVFDPKKVAWRKPVFFNDPNRGIYEYDEDGQSQTIRGQTVAGFRLLFNPRAK